MPRHLELPVSMPVSNHREHANSSADQLARHRPPVPKQSSSGQQDESFSINSAWNGEAPALHSYENRPADTVSAESGIASFESGVRSRSILMDSDRAFNIDRKTMKRGIPEEEWAASKHSAIAQNLPAADEQSSYAHREVKSNAVNEDVCVPPNSEARVQESMSLKYADTGGFTVEYFTSRRHLVASAMIPAGAETPNRFDITSKANQDSKASADKRHKQLPEASDLTQHPKKPRHLRKQHDQNQIAFTHSFFGFIENPMDALLVIEGCIRSNLRLFTGSAADMARTPIQSGTVIVIPANCAFVKRWRDGIHWSPSRSFGPFLLYRQVEPTYTNESHPAGPKYAPKRVQSNVAALEPTFSARTLKPNTRLVENGLTKRTITLKGSDGQKHRIVSYYCPVDVVEMSRLEAELKTGGSSSRPQQSGLLNAPPDEMFQRPMGDSRLCAISADKSVNLTTLLELSVSNSFNGDIDTEERLEHASNDAFLKRVADASDGEDGHDRQSSKRATAQKSGRDESLNEPINHHEPEYHSQTIYLENGVQSLNPPSFHSFSHPSTFLHHSTHPMGVYPPFLIAHYPLNHQPGQLPLSQQPTQQFHGMPGQPASMYQDSLHVTYGGYY